MNKPVYLALLILEISTLINEFCNNYNTPRYQNNGKIFYVDTSSLLFIPELKILQMMFKTDMIYQVMKLIGHYQKEWIKKS